MGVEIQLYSFLNLAVDGTGWSMPRLGRFNPGKKHRYPYKESWVGPKAGLDGYREMFRTTVIETRAF